ncbi:MAG: hypothetical protein PHS33_09380 [Candidatus Omnitrophica bacterium]|nr:hypothetical protein [Candidatus Omnitrophota bacterium]
MEVLNAQLAELPEPTPCPTCGMTLLLKHDTCPSCKAIIPQEVYQALTGSEITPTTPTTETAEANEFNTIEIKVCQKCKKQHIFIDDAKVCRTCKAEAIKELEKEVKNKSRKKAGKKAGKK